MLAFCVITISCKSDNVLEVELESSTQSMANELALLYEQGNPRDNYHWNKKRSIELKNRLVNVPTKKRMPLWFEYVLESFQAGNTEEAINEIHTFINSNNYTVENLVQEKSKFVIELLALCYLRLGEQQNCQANHNAYSCILPLSVEGQHKVKEGSQKAIELYELLYKKFPSDNYLWLYNLAHMTLGTYPQDVKKEMLLNFPIEDEQKNFMKFEEVGLAVNAAINGLSGGVALEDFDNDGDIDIFCTSYGMQDQARVLMYTDGKFEDRTDRANIDGIVSGLNCVHADFDNDGDVDVFILRGGWLGKGGNQPNSLLENKGNGSFVDVTKSKGIYSKHPTQTACWADINNDGKLDLFIGNESFKDIKHPCELYVQQKDGTFKEMSNAHGLSNIVGFIKGVTFGDINNDGWPDLYLSNMTGKNKLFKNNNGVFINVSESSKVESPIESFGCWFWDINNDGFEDLFVSGYDLKNLKNVSADFSKELRGVPSQNSLPKLYINNKDETFNDVTEKYGLNKSMYIMGSNFGDLDNDGHLDMYLGTGAPDFSTVVPNRMFRNVNGERFEEVTSQGNFGHIQKGHGIGFADFDQDGDQDIYAVMGGAFEADVFTNILFKNPSKNTNWIILTCIGTKTNRSAIGTRVCVTLENGRKIFRTIGSTSSFGGNTLRAEIGLGINAIIKEVSISWPSGQKELHQLKANNHYIIEESGRVEQIPYNAIPFNKSSHKHHHNH